MNVHKAVWLLGNLFPERKKSSYLPIRGKVNNLWRKTALTGFVWFLSHNVSQMDEKKNQDTHEEAGKI
jgi:hypothetical protein